MGGGAGPWRGDSGAQPLQLGLSLSVSVSLGLRSQTSQVLWKLIPYSPKDLKSELTQSSPPPAPLHSSGLCCTPALIPASALVLATLLKGTLQAPGRSFEARGEDLRIGISVPDRPPSSPRER